MDWLSEIKFPEEDLYVKDDDCWFTLGEGKRMARVLRELALLASLYKAVDVDWSESVANKLNNVIRNLSDDAKELCVAARESCRE